MRALLVAAALWPSIVYADEPISDPMEYARIMAMALAVEDECDDWFVVTDGLNEAENRYTFEAVFASRDLIPDLREKARAEIREAGCEKSARDVAEAFGVPFVRFWEQQMPKAGE